MRVDAQTERGWSVEDEQTEADEDEQTEAEEAEAAEHARWLAEQERWDRLTDRQRDCEIKAAMR